MNVERGKLDQACERFGIAYQTAKDSAWVAAAFPERSDRSDLLEWTHHRVVAGRDDAVDLLAWAEAEGATVKQLRERVREILHRVRGIEQLSPARHPAR